MFTKFLLSVFASLFLVFSSGSNVYAKIVINEVLNNPSGEENGAEWVELFNTGDSPVTLYGCTLFLDDTAVYQKIAFGENDFIDKFEVINAWDDSWLSNSGDTVKIECGSDSDIVAYGDEQGSVVGNPADSISFGRNPDGIGSFSILANVTLGEANSAPPTPTPNPTNTLTPTQSPTSTSSPTATLIPKPTFTPLPTATPKPSNTPTSVISQFSDSPTQTEIASTGVVAGESDEVAAEFSDKINKEFPTAAIIMIIAGVILLSISLVPIIRNFKKKI